MIPVAIGQLLGNPSLGILAGLSAMLVGLSDPAGDYRVRAFVLLTAVASIVSMFTLSPIFGETIWLAAPVMGLVTFIGAMLGVFGSAFAKVGLVSSLAMLIGLAVISVDTPAIDRFLVTTAGALLAMAMALWAWPFRPFEPLLQSTADGFHRFSSLMASLAAFTVDEDRSQQHWQDTVKDDREALATSINETRSAIIGERMLRTGRNSTIDAVLLLIHLQHQMTVAAIALAEALQQLKNRSQPNDAMSMLVERMQQLAEQADHIGTSIEAQLTRSRQAGSADADTQASAGSASNPDSGQNDHDTSPDTDVEAALDELRAIASDMEAADEIIEGARRPLVDRDPSVPVKPRKILREAGGRFAANLTFQSLMFRHALRLGVTVTFAVVVTRLLGIHQGFWVPLTVILVLKPDFGGSRKMAIDRTLATLAGGGVAAVVVAFVLNIYALYAIVIITAVIAFSELAYNYRWGVTFLTIFIIALLNLSDPGNWVLAVERVLYTAIGGALAIVAGYLLWPLWMRAVVPEKIALAMSANHSYFDQVAAAYRGVNDPEALRQSRRATVLSNSNEEVAFQRFLVESGREADNAGSFYELGVANRQFSDRLTALVLHHGTANMVDDEQIPEPFTSVVDTTLDRLEKAVHNTSPPGDLPDLNQALRQATGEQHSGAAAAPSTSLASPTGSSVVAVELARLVSDLQLMVRATGDLISPASSDKHRQTSADH